MKSLKKVLLIIFALIAAIILYAHFIEPRQITTDIIKIRNDRLAAVLKDKTVLHLTDIHISDNKNHLLPAILDKINELNPDLIFLTGDYVDWFSGNPAYDKAEHFLAKLNATYGVFAVMGDADYTLSRRHCLFCHTEGTAKPPTRHRVRFLRDSSVVIEIGGKQLKIIGINTRPNIHRYDKRQLAASLDSLPAILLSHTSLPYNDISSEQNLLMLSGDTHGGQVWLPIWIWKLVERKPDPSHMYGHFAEQNKHLFVSNGIGTSHLDIRFGVPPQIAVLKFVPEKR